MAETRLSTALSGRIEQQQRLSLSQQQSLKLLAMPAAELEMHIKEELSSNPMLEDVTPPQEAMQENFDDNSDDQEVSAEGNDPDDIPLPPEEKASENRDFFSNLPAPPPPLRSVLRWELDSMDLSAEKLRYAQEIVSALDENGYLGISLADLAMICDASMDEMDEALQIVQSVAPAGVAARNLPECLKLQLARRGRLTDKLAELLDNGIAELARQDYPALAKKLSVSSGELSSMLQTLRSLDPAPGREKAVHASVIIPDLQITCDSSGQWSAAAAYNASDRMTISPMYEKLLAEENLSAEDRNFLSEKLKDARELIKAVHMRENTLSRLGSFLVEKQRDFLMNGKKYLKPMTMKNAADALDVSESTISRCVSEKYADTPQGVIPLKSFFSSGYESSDGGISVQAILEKIRSITAAEDPAKPLSDSKIADILKKDGIDLARRTVAKYREQIHIPAASVRKKIGFFNENSK